MHQTRQTLVSLLHVSTRRGLPGRGTHDVPKHVDSLTSDE